MIEVTWPAHVRMPPKYNMAREGEEHFARASAVISTAVHAKVADLSLPAAFRAFDFGAGIGRTAIPLYYRHGYPQSCSDVDSKCTAYLREVLPSSVEVLLAQQGDPIFQASSSLDLVISVSVFTHLPEVAQDYYLQEVARILKPGGYGLLTVSSHTALASRKKKRIPGWSEVTNDDLERLGFIYKPEAKSKDGSYGYALHSNRYIQDHWSRYFDVVSIDTDYIHNVQDLVTVRRRQE